MKLKAEQLKVLQDTLRECVTYRETYEEVYDHVLSALENSHDNAPLGQTINSILLHDFGGFAGLRLMERKRRWAVGRQMIAKQWQYLLAFLKLPLLPLTCILYYVMYYCIKELEFQVYPMLIFSTAVWGILIFRGIRYLNRRFILKNSKKSIKDYPFHIISYAPFFILFIVKVTQLNFFKDMSFSLHPLVLSLIYTLYGIYIISFIKLHMEQFKKHDAKLV